MKNGEWVWKSCLCLDEAVNFLNTLPDRSSESAKIIPITPDEYRAAAMWVVYRDWK